MKNNFCPLLVLLFLILPIFGDDTQTKIPQNVVGRNLPDAQVSGNSLATSQECENDVAKFCSKKISSSKSNIEVLRCIDDLDNAHNLIEKSCQHLIYKFKYSMTRNINFDNASMQLCSNDLQVLKECNSYNDDQGTGRLISCLHDRIENITELHCRRFISQLESIIFTDWRFSEYFTISCIPEITKFQCGRLDVDNDTLSHEQGAVISCLMEHSDDLSSNCSKGIERIAEIQSKDYHLDRKFYLACRDDRERFCSKVAAGNGRIYRCLYEKKFDSLLSPACRTEVHRRQKMVAANIKLDTPFMKACNNEIKEHNCIGDEKEKNSQVKLVNMLLCLEERKKKGQTINEECGREILIHRQMLFSDFLLSPEIVSQCRPVIIGNCSKMIQISSMKDANQRAGRMVHCLVNAVRSQRNVDNACLNAVKALIRAVNPASDIRSDPFLEKTCRPVTNILCPNVKADSANLIVCLMQNLQNTRMTEDCQDLLLDLAYFTQRDWRLTPLFLRTCRTDLEKKCGLSKSWSMKDDVSTKELSSYIHCLYQQRANVGSECQEQLKKTMLIRSQSVGLLPEVEEACMNDLSKCKTSRKGEEIRCLQSSYHELEDECQEAVKKHTKIAMSDANLDFYLVKSCENLIQVHCSKNSEDESSLLRCLFKNKNDPKMNFQCRSSIEFHQITSLKDRAFLSERFQKQCKAELDEHCRTIREKSKLIECLSNIILTDALKQKPSRINNTCRSELKFELLQRNENIQLDPSLKSACQVDIKKFCAKVTPGNAQVLDCLKRNDDELSQNCLTVLRKRTKLDILMPSNDYSLISKCHSTIEKFCANEREENLLICLRKQMNDEKMTGSCRNALLYRMMIYNTDARLNKNLITKCQKDILRLCAETIDTSNDEDETLFDRQMSGRILNCLRTRYAEEENDLESSCLAEVADNLKSSKGDVRLDAQLYENCRLVLQRFCPGTNKEDCLRLLFQKNQLKDEKCRQQVIRRIREGKTDLHNDENFALTCQNDIEKFCLNVPIGEGRQLRCLSKNRKKLSTDCQKILKDREELWNKIPDQSGFNSFTEFISNFNEYFGFIFSVFILSSIIFCFGWICRSLLRNKRLQKKK